MTAKKLSTLAGLTGIPWRWRWRAPASPPMNECLYCKEHLEERRVTRYREFEGRRYIIENLPALVCPQCGGTFYTPEAHDRVVDLITGNAEPVRIEAVSVMDASKAS